MNHDMQTHPSPDFDAETAVAALQGLSDTYMKAADLLRELFARWSFWPQRAEDIRESAESDGKNFDSCMDDESFWIEILNEQGKELFAVLTPIVDRLNLMAEGTEKMISADGGGLSTDTRDYSNNMEVCDKALAAALSQMTFVLVAGFGSLNKASYEKLEKSIEIGLIEPEEELGVSPKNAQELRKYAATSGLPGVLVTVASECSRLADQVAQLANPAPSQTQVSGIRSLRPYDPKHPPTPLEGMPLKKPGRIQGSSFQPSPPAGTRPGTRPPREGRAQ